MYYKFFRWFISLFIALAISLGGSSPALAAPPANDNFADAEVINSFPFSVTADVTESTAEPGEPLNCTTILNRTVWYSFTPTETMSIHVDMQGGAADGLVNIYHATGTGLSDLQHLQCVVNPGSSSTFLAEAGQVYYLQVSGNVGGIGTFQVNLQQVFPPANDIFANAEAITSLPFSASPDLTDTTVEPNEPNGCSLSQQTVWYFFTPAQTMSVRVDTLGGAVNGFVSIYHATGSGISNLQYLTCVYGSSPSFLAEGGQTYYLQVSPSGGNGIIQINLQQVFPPANDNFANAEVVSSLPFTATVDSTDTGVELGEPNNCGSQQTVWYSFTPAQTMSVRVDTIDGIGGAVTGIVGIYHATGNGIFNLQHLTCVYGYSITFLAEGGQTYYLQVSPYIGNSTIQINLQQVFTPLNDIFANAEVISSLPFTATVAMTDTGVEFGEPNNCGLPQQTIWYSFTPAQTMSVRVDTQGPLGATVPGIVDIFQATGNGFANLQHLACIYGSSSTFLAEAGQTYYLQAGPGPSIGGSGTIQINLQQISPSTMEVGIDIKPGDARNQIEIKSKNKHNDDKISVAILSTAQFNAPQQVDKNSLTFGATGDETSLILKGRKHQPDCQVKDVNKDRLPDLVCQFMINKTGFRPGDTIGILKGMTLTGNPFTGQDLVKIKRSSHEHDDHNHGHHDD
jgi:hypothetical protein